MGTILLVDNHAGFRSSVTRYLTLGGFRVVEAASGAEALLVLASSSDIELIVTDLEMPEISGYDLIRKVREDSKLNHIPILVLSVAGRPGLREVLLALGANGFMQKPFSLPQFLEQVKPLLP